MKRLLAPVLKNQGNRFAQVRETFVAGLAPTFGSGHVGAVRDVPGAVLLDNRREFVVQ